MGDDDATTSEGLTDEQHDWASSFCGISTRIGQSVAATVSTVATDVGNAARDAASGLAATVETVAADAGKAAAGTLAAAQEVAAGLPAGAAINAAGDNGADASASILPHIPPAPSMREIGEFGVGLVRGAGDALTPLGVGGLQPTPMDKSKPFELGRGLGQMAVSVAEMAAGADAEIVGGLLDVTGVGAAVGVPVNVAGAALIVQGAASGMVGAKTLGHAMTMHGEGGGESSQTDDDRARQRREDYDEKYGDLDNEGDGSRTGKMQTGTKSELENSGWLKERLPDPELRRRFMQDLEANHELIDPKTGKHLHYEPGAPNTEARLQQWAAENNVQLAK